MALAAVPFVEPDATPVLPGRAARRLEAADERIGPFDFLATIGCPLAELAAERNGPLGRVMVPSRRWDYERRVIVAIEERLPTLAPERAARLASILERKRVGLVVHRWTALWISEEVERYLRSRCRCAPIDARCSATRTPPRFEARYRQALVGHARAWTSTLTACRLLPASGA